MPSRIQSAVVAPWPLTEAQERECLALDPFAGSKGDDTYRTVRDGFVRTRVDHDCSLCWETIDAGSRARRMAQIDDGQAKSFYLCGTCCLAMAVVDDDAGEALEARYALGIERSRPLE